MGQWYTSGDWIVKAGCEDAFREAWEETAAWTREHIVGSSWAVLAQDVSDPCRFRSFGEWDSPESIRQWRSDEGFRQRNDSLMGLVESFESCTGKTVAEVV